MTQEGILPGSLTIIIYCWRSTKKTWDIKKRGKEGKWEWNGRRKFINTILPVSTALSVPPFPFYSCLIFHNIMPIIFWARSINQIASCCSTFCGCMHTSVCVLEKYFYCPSVNRCEWLVQMLCLCHSILLKFKVFWPLQVLQESRSCGGGYHWFLVLTPTPRILQEFSRQNYGSSRAQTYTYTHLHCNSACF